MASMKNENNIPSTVGQYMNTNVVTLDSLASVFEAARTMEERGVSSVAITSGGKIAGILTERDIVRLIAYGVSPEGIITKSLMSCPLESITKESPIDEAVRLMLRKHIRHLLVLNSEHQAVGIITSTDLALYLKDMTSQRIGSSEIEQSPLNEVWELFF